MLCCESCLLLREITTGYQQHFITIEHDIFAYRLIVRFDIFFITACHSEQFLTILPWSGFTTQMKDLET